jgi:hypothetical protein
VHKIRTLIRQNAIALVALFVALGGSSYAAFSINGSQIRNHTIDAVKLDPNSIAGSIRAWAIIYGGSTSVTAGPASSKVRVRSFGVGESITWIHRRFTQSCMPMATPLGTPTTGGYGSVTTQFDAHDGSLTLQGFGPDKVGRPQPVYVMIVCP